MIQSSIHRFFSSTKTCKIFFGDKGRQGILKGIQLINKATQSTLGPKGKNVALEYEMGIPRITKDGVTVAKNIMFHEIGASLVRKASGTTNVYAGDGTTTSTIIASNIIKYGLKYIEQNANPIEIKRGIEKGRDKIIEFLEEISQPVETKEHLFNLAMVSTNYQKDIAQVISDVLWEVGIDGVIDIEPGGSLKTELFFTKGLTLNRPFASQQFITNQNTLKVEIQHPMILIVNTALNSIRDIVPVLELAKSQKKTLFIAAQDISEEALSNLVFNHIKKIVEVCAITVPGMGNFSTLILEEMALMTGARCFGKDDKDALQKIKISDLGKAMKVTCSSMDTFISGGQGDPAEIQKRIDIVNNEIKQTTSENGLKILKDRLGRLTGKMAVVAVGGASEYEIFETRDKIVDGLNAVKLGLKTGYLPGGGVGLLRASELLKYVQVDNFDQKCGLDILSKVLQEPIRVLAENANLNGGVIIDNLLTKYKDNIRMGFDLNKNSYVDMVDAGVIDSFQVVKTALEDGLSVGSMVLTTEAVIIKEKVYIAPKLNTYRKKIF